MAEAWRRGQEIGQDMVTDDAENKDGEERKVPLGCLAGPPYLVTLFTELRKAAKRAGLGKLKEWGFGYAPFETLQEGVQ